MTARRGRYYVARVAYGLFLLLALWLEYQKLSGLDPRYITIRNMSRFAESTFLAFAGAQGLALLVMVPALVAGTIADERQRRTLPDLLATGLTAAEIVLGKLGARLVHVGVFLLLGLPVVALIGLFGGLDPWDVAAVTLGTVAVTLFVAGLSILVSVVTPRPRRSVATAYSLVATWLFLPFVVGPLAPHFAWPLRWWLKPVNDAVLATNPLVVWSRLSGVMAGRIYVDERLRNGFRVLWYARQANQAFDALLLMAWLQLVFGALFLVMAIWSLRWTATDRGGWRVRRRGRRRPEPTVPARPGCGDDPMFWKERYAPGDGRRSWLSSRPVVLVLGVALGCYLFDAAWPAIAGLVRQVQGPGFASDSWRQYLNGELRLTGAIVVTLALLAVAGSAAASISEEREQGTWISLLTTLLTGREIVVAKLFGAVWGARRLVATVLAIWGVGLLAGAIGPLGFLAATAALGVLLGSAAALGLYVSLRARNTSRALVTAIGILIALNLGVVMAARVTAAAVLAGQVADDAHARNLWLAGAAPYVAWAAPSVDRVAPISPRGRGAIEVPGGDAGRARRDGAIVALGLVLHAGYALALARAAIRQVRAKDAPPRVPGG